jgi:hypothetical protein
MKISATGGGGFAGQTAHFDVDTSQVANGRTIETLVSDIGFFSRPPTEAIGADMVRWTITIDDGPRSHTVTFAEDGSAESAPWQTLLAHVRGASR